MARRRMVMKRTEAQRWCAKVVLPPNRDDCWAWLGHHHQTKGHGIFTYRGGKPVPAHRWGYERFIAPVPPELHMDHLCRNPGCVNPAHLEPVTPGENVLRGFSFSAINKRKTHCLRGHEFTEANTIRYTFNGYHKRACRTCKVANTRERYHAGKTRRTRPYVRKRPQVYTASQPANEE